MSSFYHPPPLSSAQKLKCAAHNPALPDRVVRGEIPHQNRPIVRLHRQIVYNAIRTGIGQIGRGSGHRRNHVQTKVRIVEPIHRPCRRIPVVKQDGYRGLIHGAHQRRPIVHVAIKEQLKVLVELGQRVIGNGEDDLLGPKIILPPIQTTATGEVVIPQHDKIGIGPTNPDGIVRRRGGGVIGPGLERKHVVVHLRAVSVVSSAQEVVDSVPEVGAFSVGSGPPHPDAHLAPILVDILHRPIRYAAKIEDGVGGHEDYIGRIVRPHRLEVPGPDRIDVRVQDPHQGPGKSAINPGRCHLRTLGGIGACIGQDHGKAPVGHGLAAVRKHPDQEPLGHFSVIEDQGALNGQKIPACQGGNLLSRHQYLGLSNLFRAIIHQHPARSSSNTGNRNQHTRNSELVIGSIGAGALLCQAFPFRAIIHRHLANPVWTYLLTYILGGEAEYTPWMIGPAQDHFTCPGAEERGLACHSNVIRTSCLGIKTQRAGSARQETKATAQQAIGDLPITHRRHIVIGRHLAQTWSGSLPCKPPGPYPARPG